MPAQRAPAATPARVTTSRFDWTALACAAALAAATALAYGGIFAAPLIFDDVPAVAENPTIRHLGSAFQPPIDMTVSARPVLNLSLALNYAVGGTEVRGYHATNLAIHILAGLALFGIVRRTLVRRGSPAASPVAFSAALLWLLHPLQTESVTYVVQRAESLMGLFYLLTLYLFIRGAESETQASRPWCIMSVAACLLGMATKEVMVSAPLVALLYDRAFLAGTFRDAWRRRWPVYAGLAATWLILPYLVVSAHGRGGSAGFGAGVPWWSYAMTQVPAVIHYLRLSLWPHPLIFDYGSSLEHPSLRVAACAIGVAFLAAAAARAFFRNSAAGFVGASFFALLAPSSSIVPVATETMAEHRMYLPLACVVVLVVAVIYRWLGRAALPLCLVLAAVLFWATTMRNAVYSTEEGIWRDTVAGRPYNERAHNNLGYLLSRMPGRSGEAIAQYEEALLLKPDYGQAHDNLGFALAAVPGRLGEAVVHYEEAVRLLPDDAEAHYNLAVALASMPGRSDEMIARYTEALRLRPDYPEAHYNLGCALLAIPGRQDEAVAQFEDALRLKPGLADAHYNLGRALETASGRQDEAVVQYREALRLKPDFPEAHYSLAAALQSSPGTMDEAIGQYEEALRLRPDFFQAHFGLASALQAIPGRQEEAATQFEAALLLKPDNATVHLDLALVLLKLPGRSEEAVAQLNQAVLLQPDNDVARRILARIRAPAQ
jgi:protein O-mannosyl-transferase